VVRGGKCESGKRGTKIAGVENAGQMWDQEMQDLAGSEK